MVIDTPPRSSGTAGTRSASPRCRPSPAPAHRGRAVSPRSRRGWTPAAGPGRPGRPASTAAPACTRSACCPAHCAAGLVRASARWPSTPSPPGGTEPTPHTTKRTEMTHLAPEEAGKAGAPAPRPAATAEGKSRLSPSREAGRCSSRRWVLPAGRGRRQPRGSPRVHAAEHAHQREPAHAGIGQVSGLAKLQQYAAVLGLPLLAVLLYTAYRSPAPPPPGREAPGVSALADSPPACWRAAWSSPCAVRPGGSAARRATRAP